MQWTCGEMKKGLVIAFQSNFQKGNFEENKHCHY